MSVNLLTNRRRKTRGGSVYADGNQTEAVANTNQEPIGRASITSDLRINEEPTSQNTLAPMRTRTIGFDLPSNVEDLQSHKADVGETTRTQPRRWRGQGESYSWWRSGGGDPGTGRPLQRPEKLEAKGDEVLKDNTKRRGNAREDMQARFTAAKSARVWDTYVRKAEEEDKDLVEDWDQVIDVTLVFAALFSAISTGFVLESSKGLQPDQAKATVLAVQSLASAIQVGANGSTVPTTESYEDSFKPTVLTIWVNCLWFLSLGLSISVSLFAMLAKRWCYVFRSKRTGTSHERATKRQQQWDAIEKWKIELVIEQLPTLMHIALMLFFFGLVVYLAEIHQTTMIVTGALAGFTIVLYFILTALPLWYPNCPMVTPFTRIALAIRWYTLKGFKFMSTQTWLHSENASVLSRILNLRQEVSKPDLRKFLDAAVSAPKETFRLIRMALISLWAQPVRFTRVIVSFTEQKNLNNGPEWVMDGHVNGEIGKTVRRPRPDETNRQAFNALAWILSNTTDREVVKEVLDYIMSFPDVILDSFAGSGQLYMVASAATEHLNRLQHDPAEWRRTTHINSSCAWLIYLTTLPWLHEPQEDGSKYAEIRRLLYGNSQVGSADMSSEELDGYVSTISEELVELSEPVLWLEDLAGKVVLGWTPGLGLKICTALGRTLLNEETRLHARHLDAELYPTTWWIFLNNVVDCTGGRWPSNKYEERAGELPLASCASNSALTLGHFRDSRKRQESGLWLTVVGITGMLYAFTRYPDDENGPMVDGNSEYFVRLINFLRTTLRNSLFLYTDPFLGCLPVYSKTEIRLYQFDSLQYGIDAVTCALDSPTYSSCSFLSDLRMLLRDLNELKVLKDLLQPKETQDVDHNRTLGFHESRAQDHNAADIFLTTGALLINPLQTRVSRECAHLLASLVSDIIFGCGGLDQPTSPAPPKGCIGMVPSIDQYISASETITSWAWMPFDMSVWLPGVLKTKYPNYRHRNMLWEPLEGAGLLHNPAIPHWSAQSYLFFRNYYNVEHTEEGMSDAYRAGGYCLYIKASLLDRLYASSAADVHSPDVIAWSIALSHHVVELLQFWDAVTFDPDEQTYIIGSLMKLTNTLLDALNHATSLEPTKPTQNPMVVTQNAPTETTGARGQLEALIKAGVLQILAHPFSSRSRSPATGTDKSTQNKSEWHEALTITIEKLTRAFPCVRAETGFATAINDSLRMHGKPEWAFTQQDETSNGDGGTNHKSACNDQEVDFYSDMVVYYEARALENSEQSSPMLERVKRLRRDMEAHHSLASPRVESPTDVRIEMSQGP